MCFRRFVVRDRITSRGLNYLVIINTALFALKYQERPKFSFITTQPINIGGNTDVNSINKMFV